MNDEFVITFLLFTILFLIIFIMYQFTAYRTGLRARLREIGRKLKEINDTGSDEKIFTFMDNEELKELAAQINRLLENHLKTKADY